MVSPDICPKVEGGHEYIPAETGVKRVLDSVDNNDNEYYTEYDYTVLRSAHCGASVEEVSENRLHTE